MTMPPRRIVKVVALTGEHAIASLVRAFLEAAPGTALDVQSGSIIGDTDDDILGDVVVITINGATAALSWGEVRWFADALINRSEAFGDPHETSLVEFGRALSRVLANCDPHRSLN
jgi:hypothetical protein